MSRHGFALGYISSPSFPRHKTVTSPGFLPKLAAAPCHLASITSPRAFSEACSKHFHLSPASAGPTPLCPSIVARSFRWPSRRVSGAQEPCSVAGTISSCPVPQHTGSPRNQLVSFLNSKHTYAPPTSAQLFNRQPHSASLGTDGQCPQLLVGNGNEWHITTYFLHVEIDGALQHP